MQPGRDALNVLDHLNRLNTRAGKHLGGGELNWSDVALLHAGIYWALKALLDIAESPPAKNPSEVGKL
jgi:hypothetical protein